MRAAAIDAFCAIGKDKSVRSVRLFLQDADPRIRSAAITGMIRYGGLDGLLVAAEALKALIGEKDPGMREHAARVLGAIGVRNFYQPVLQLMNDADARVRRAAISAAGALKSPEFVIPLIYRAQSIDTMQDAVSALTSYGPSIVPTLAKVLGNHMEDPAIRRAVARVLGRLGTAEAVQVITAHLDEGDEELRIRLYRSLARAVKTRRLAMTDKKPVEAALEHELARAYRTLAQAEALNLQHGPGPNTPRAGSDAGRALLASALTEKVMFAERRIFLLLAVLYPDADMEQIYAGIHDATATDAPRRRGNAVELLDNLLDRHLKARFLPLLEEMPRADRLKHVAEAFDVKLGTHEETLLALCKDETAWVRACALWLLSQTDPKTTDVVTPMLAGAYDVNAIVREISLVSLGVAAPERARAIAEERLRDEAPAVRRQAALIASKPALPVSA